MNKLSKQPLAVICLSHHEGGMELASFKLTSLLSQYVKTTFIIQENTFLHRLCLEQNLPFEIATVSFRSSFSISLMSKIRAILLKHHIHNAIFVGASELKSLYFSCLGLDINLIVRHGTNKSSPKKDWFHKLIYSDVATHVAISSHLAKNVEYIVPFGSQTQLKVIFPSLSQSVITYPVAHSPLIRLLHVGRIAEGKGLKEACDACDILHQHQIDFILDSFGNMDKKYEPFFLNYYDNLPYRNAITMQAFTHEIYPQYALHDIFIFPSKGEGFGNVFMEAIAHGIICLAFKNTSFHDFAGLGFHIHLVEDGNIDALQEKLLHIIQNIENERALSKANILKAFQVFAPEREAKEYLELMF